MSLQEKSDANVQVNLNQEKKDPLYVLDRKYKVNDHEMKEMTAEDTGSL